MCAWSKPIATATARRGIAPSSISVAGMCWRSTSILASSAVCCMAMRPAMIASRTRISGRSQRGTGGRCWRQAGCGAISASTRHSTNSRGPIAARRCGPASEHALAQWLESDFVCDRCGRRFIAAWRDDAERQASRTPRVRVAARQLQQWYRTLDQLLACKAQVESALFVRLRDLFSLQVDMVFYDLTSTYFEGRGPPEIGAHGHSRDGKPRSPQCWLV